jgi:regulator of PEP synthase PpsR (kinase-PPPase family)
LVEEVGVAAVRFLEGDVFAVFGVLIDPKKFSTIRAAKCLAGQSDFVSFTRVEVELTHVRRVCFTLIYLTGFLNQMDHSLSLGK